MTDSVENNAGDDLPTLTVPMDADAVIDRLDVASRRGRMAGFNGQPDVGLFIVDAWGTPFDHDLLAMGEKATGDETRLSFSLRLRRKLPTIHAIILLLTVWPGVWLTDSMLKLWFAWYYALTQKPMFIWGGFEAFTYIWYIPLCVVPLPWFWRSIMRRSRTTSHASGLEMIGKIAKELGVTPPPACEAGNSDDG